MNSIEPKKIIRWEKHTHKRKRNKAEFWSHCLLIEEPGMLDVRGNELGL